MANSGLKIAAMLLIVSGAISAFNATGIMASPTSTNTYNLDSQTWYNITTGGSAGVSDTTGTSSNYDQYSNSGSQAVANFITGTLYAKGIIDPYFGDNWVEQLFSAMLQSILYFAGLIGALSWLLNKYQNL